MMDCEAARALTADALADGIDEEKAAALERHLADCPACAAQAESLHSLWRDLGRLTVPAPAPGAAARILAAIEEAREEVTAGSSPSGSTVRDHGAGGPYRAALLAASIALLLGSAAGWIARARFDTTGDTAATALASADSDLRTFLLLLRGPAPQPGSPPSDSAVAAAVARYAAWADTLDMRGQLVLAEKLEDDTGRWLGGARTDASPASEIGGLFLIRAHSWEEAEAISSGSPHLGRGGTIELRAIQDTGGL